MKTVANYLLRLFAVFSVVLFVSSYSKKFDPWLSELNEYIRIALEISIVIIIGYFVFVIVASLLAIITTRGSIDQKIEAARKAAVNETANYLVPWFKIRKRN